MFADKKYQLHTYLTELNIIKALNLAAHNKNWNLIFVQQNGDIHNQRPFFVDKMKMPKKSENPF